jgi:hypothetical protein
VPGGVLGLGCFDLSPVIQARSLPGFRIAEHPQLQRVLGGVLRAVVRAGCGGVGGGVRVAGVAAVLAVMAAQLPHWPFRPYLPTLGLDLKHG